MAKPSRALVRYSLAGAVLATFAFLGTGIDGAEVRQSVAPMLGIEEPEVTPAPCNRSKLSADAPSTDGSIPPTQDARPSLRASLLSPHAKQSPAEYAKLPMIDVVDAIGTPDGEKWAPTIASLFPSMETPEDLIAFEACDRALDESTQCNIPGRQAIERIGPGKARIVHMEIEDSSDVQCQAWAACGLRKRVGRIVEYPDDAPDATVIKSGFIGGNSAPMFSTEAQINWMIERHEQELERAMEAAEPDGWLQYKEAALQWELKLLRLRLARLQGE